MRKTTHRKASARRVGLFTPGCHTKYAGPNEVSAHSFAESAWKVLLRWHTADELRALPVDVLRLELSRSVILYKNDVPVVPTRDYARLVLAHGWLCRNTHEGAFK